MFSADVMGEEAAAKYGQGFGAWFALLVVFLTSIERLRRKKYHVFYALHFSFVFFYLFAALHSRAFRFYAWVACGIYGFDKLQRIAKGVLSKTRVERIDVVASGQILRLSIPKPWWSKPQLGQYVFLNFPEISRWEWHPYTLASSPLETNFEVDVKKLGEEAMKGKRV